MEKKDLLNKSYALAAEACNALIELLEKTGEITLNPEEHAAADEDEPKEGYDPSIWLTIYYEDNESHEHVLLSIDTRYSKTLGMQVFDCKTYDLVTDNIVELNSYGIPTTDAGAMCALYDDIYDVAVSKGLLKD